MFFYFSKILSFIFAPLTWIIVLLILALLIKNKKKSRNLVFISLMFLYLFSNPFLADEMIRLWEIPVVKTNELEEKYQAGIVLGGGMMTSDNENKRLTFRFNVDRIMQAIHLYKEARIGKILISGGSGSLLYRDMIESELLKKYFTGIGIDPKDIVVESRSDNTYQNAKNTKVILSEQFNNGPYLLITSSLHMKRAKACFDKQNIDVDIYPTNQIVGSRRYQFSHLFIPDTESFRKWNIFLHEVVGFVIYKIMGYI